MDSNLDWAELLVDQADWHWTNQLRPRLEGMTDDEYRWEPVAGAWSVRPRGTSATKMAAGSGEFVIDWEFPQPEPAPVTTIAWRIGHLVVGVFGMRVAAHFGGPEMDDNYQAWMAGVRKADLAEPCGPAEGPFADSPMARLVLHINRELLHHGAEIALLRDLYRWRPSSPAA
jgi:hypothetical protein